MKETTREFIRPLLRPLTLAIAGTLIALLTWMDSHFFAAFFLTIYVQIGIFWNALMLVLSLVTYIGLIYFISIWEDTAKEVFARNRLKQSQ